MKKKTVIIISILAIVVILAGIYIFKLKNKTDITYWRSVQVEKGDVNVIVTATGTMAADTSVDVGVQVSGTVAKINADFNSIVIKGQIIAVLDTTLYYAAVVDAKATLQRGKIAVDETKREFDRAKNLFDNKVAAQADYDQAMTNYQTAEGNLVSAQAQLDKAVINLQYCTIRAPISGMIIARNVQVGNMVIASMSSPVLYTIAYDQTRMQVQVDVDEADIGQIKEGQQAKFTVDAYPNDIFIGKVTQIRHQPIMVQNVVNYVVIIEVANPDMKLMPGLTANSNISIQERKDVLKIPSIAFSFTPPVDYIQKSILLPDTTKKFWLKKLRQTDEIKKQQIVEHNVTTAYIWIKRGVDIFPVLVTRGLNDGSFTEISGDIKEGDEVVTGVNHSPNAKEATATKNPFTPTFPSQKKK